MISTIVIPAQAGIAVSHALHLNPIPACAGMTNWGAGKTDLGARMTKGMGA